MTTVQKKTNDFYHAYPARTWPAKKVVIYAGDHPEGVYMIEKGGLRQYTIDHRGVEVVVNAFKPPAFAPIVWAFSDKPCGYFFETTEDSVLRCAPKEDVLDFLRKNADVSLDLLARMSSGVEGLLSRMTLLMSGSAYSRLVHELILQTKRLHLAKQTNISLPLKEYELGALCGLSRETVSREFKKLKSQKLVSVDTTGITIIDLAELEKALEE